MTDSSKSVGRVKPLDLAVILKMAMRCGYDGAATSATFDELWIGYSGDCSAMDRVQAALYGSPSPSIDPEVHRQVVEALRKIARNEKKVFDDDLGCKVIIGLDPEEMAEIAEAALSFAGEVR